MWLINWKKSIAAFAILLLTVFGAVGTVPETYALGSNDQNPFITEDHPGAANELAVPGLDDASETTGGQRDALIDVIKSIVNWVLGILALIALIVLMYGGFLMVTAAGNEDGYKKGWTILRQAAVGLILIGIAWFIVSIVFWLVAQTAEGAIDADTFE